MKKEEDDGNLENRLKHLKRQDSKVDQKELEFRLAKLKGIDPTKYTAPPITVYQPPDARTDVEKADGLLAQMMEESAIDQGTCEFVPHQKRLSVDDQLQERLNRLRGESGAAKAPEKFDMDVTLDSDEEAEKIMERLLSESLLPEVPCESITDEDRTVFEQAKKINEEAQPKKKKAIEAEVDDEEELPWCEICNEDARLKCHDCEDLYCLSCFKEFHNDPETRRHKTSSYRRYKEL
jgi:hypothetical protein